MYVDGIEDLMLRVCVDCRMGVDGIQRHGAVSGRTMVTEWFICSLRTELVIKTSIGLSLTQSQLVELLQVPDIW